MTRPWYEVAYLRIYVAVLVSLRRVLLARPVEIIWVGCLSFLMLIGVFYIVDLLPISWIKSDFFSFFFPLFMTFCIVVSLSSIFFALYRLIRKPAASDNRDLPRTHHNQTRRVGLILIKSTVPWCCALVFLSWLGDLSPLTTLRGFGWLPFGFGFGALVLAALAKPKRSS